MIFPNRRHVVLASALVVGIVGASAGTMVFAKQAKKGERVTIVLTTVKAGKQQQFEDYMTKFEAALEIAQKMDATTKKAAAQTRALYPAKPNEDGTFTYVFLMDPVLPDPNAYEMIEVLKMALKENEADGSLCGWRLSQHQRHFTSHRHEAVSLLLEGNGTLRPRLHQLRT